MNVLFVTQYGPRAASSRTRVFQYLPYLRAQGVDCRVLTVLPDAALAGSQLVVTRRPLAKILYYLSIAWRTLVIGLQVSWQARRADVLFVQKVIFPAPVRWLLTRTRTPMVYDFDDAIFTTEVRGGSRLARWKERRNAAGLPAMLRLARRAVVENDYTGDFARPFCPITTITGPIDTTPFEGISRNGRCAEAPVRLGWIGSATTVGYLDLIEAPLRQLAAEGLAFRVCVVGAQWAPAGLPVECRKWDLDREAEDLGGWDVGLMPLPDDPWTRGKGGYKLLQYMAAGLPVVADPVGVNREIVVHGQTGWLAENADDWVRHLRQLISEPAVRQSFGEIGRKRVAARYALAVQQPALLQMLRELAP